MSDVLKARICGWGLLVGSLALLSLTGAMNWFQGDHLGVTMAGKLINSVGSVAVDVFGLMFCGLAAGVCLANKRWGWGFIFALAVVCSAGWSINSMFGYQATERISATKTHEAEFSRVKDADKLEKESAKKALDLAKNAGTRSARKDFIAANQDAIKSFRDAKITVIVAPDQGAQSLAEKLGWKIETIQYIQAGYFAILVIFLKMVGFPGSGFLISWNPEPFDRKVSGTPEGSGGKVKVSEEPKEKQPETVARKAEIVPLRKAAAPVAPSPDKKALTVSQYLAQHAGVTHTSQAAISAGTGLSPATVSRHLKKLEGRGKVKRSQHKRAKAVTYGGQSHAFGH